MNNHYPTICTSCVMDTTDPNIVFDQDGVCQSCKTYYKTIEPSWNYGKNKEAELSLVLEKIKKAGKNKAYDCLLGLSGGLDSSYLLHMAIKEWGLRPLVFHVDAGWNTDIAKDNINKMINKLGIDLKIKTMNWQEMKALQIAFFKSGVAHLDIPQDNAFVGVLDDFAKKNNIKYVLNGGNIASEVIVNPLSWCYWGTDSKQNKDIVKQFSPIKIKEYTFTNIFQRKIIMPYFYGVKVVKPLNYIPYVKKEAEKFLNTEYGYIAYGQKHFEDIITKFIEGYWLPKRFGFDVRKPQLSSLVLTKQISRTDALKILSRPALSETEQKELFSQVASMLDLNENELESFINLPLKYYTDYKNSDWIFSLGKKILFALKLDKLIRN